MAAPDRRAFLAVFASAGLTSTLLPGVLWAQMQQGTRPVTMMFQFGRRPVPSDACSTTMECVDSVPVTSTTAASDKPSAAS